MAAMNHLRTIIILQRGAMIPTGHRDVWVYQDGQEGTTKGALLRRLQKDGYAEFREGAMHMTDLGFKAYLAEVNRQNEKVKKPPVVKPQKRDLARGTLIYRIRDGKEIRWEPSLQGATDIARRMQAKHWAAGEPVPTIEVDTISTKALSRNNLVEMLNKGIEALTQDMVTTKIEPLARLGGYRSYLTNEERFQAAMNS